MEEFLDKLRVLQYRALMLVQHFGTRFNNTVNTITVLLAVLGIGNVAWQIGFPVPDGALDWMIGLNRFIIIFFGLVPIVHAITSLITTRHMSLWQLAYIAAVWAFIANDDGSGWMSHRYVIDAVVVVLSIYELSSLSIPVLTRKSSPTTLFAGSFILFILVGAGLLLMPRCHYDDLSFLDAVFTSTSAVCVVGLSVFDIGNEFTPFGQTIVLLLIQVGGLGVMTFTCFFAMTLMGKGSLQNRIIIKDLISADNMSDIFTTLKHIMYVTFIIEGISAWVLYYQFREALPGSPIQDIVFTAVFHSISAFCNAGISNLPNGLTNHAIIGCHGIHMVIAVTLIFGGAGFPLQSAAINWTKYHVGNFFLRLLGRKISRSNMPRMISASNRLVFYTHILLLLIGTLIFFFIEIFYSNDDRSVGILFADSFFLSATSRTAGFMYGDIIYTQGPSFVVFLVLMCIGCAPMSTGGGMKVTTFALCVLNLRNTLLGRDNIEIFGRRVSQSSVNKAFAIVILQVAAIMLSTMALKIAMPGTEINKLMFESVSALSTVGLSMDLTPTLNTAGRIIVMADMFIGRIGVMAFMLMFVTPKPPLRIKYPSENIMV